jgi:hypothetical protein
MANLVVNIRQVVHSVRDFIAQEPPVTLPQIVELLFYHCLCNSQSSREIGIRYLAASRGKVSAQRFEQPEPAFAFAFLAETLQGVFYNCCRPTEIKKLLRQNILEGLSRDGQLRGRFGHPFVPGNELYSPTAFNRASSFFGVTEKILKRLKQKRAEAAAMFVGAPKPVALQDHGEKILGEILRFLHRVTLTTYEHEDRPPVRPAKFGERFARILLIGVRARGGKNQAPARRAEPARFG